MKEAERYSNFSFPLLLAKISHLTNLIISYFHSEAGHFGAYNTVCELRCLFWIPSAFSTVKKMIQSCVICKCYNSRHIQLNLSAYNFDRFVPAEVPFRNIVLEYFGSFTVKFGKFKRKVWILILVCNYTRTVNLEICV